MINSNHWFKRRLQAVPASLVIVMILVALIGFADAGYLTVEHYQHVIPPCSITGGCERVLTSGFSTVFGLPVSLLGLIYYFLIAAGLFAFFESRNHEVLRMTLLFTILGLLASMWFVFLQVFIIHSYCTYCLGSAATSTILFIFAAIIFEKYKKDIELPL
jgi:uncharacterized membrane protein